MIHDGTLRTAVSNRQFVFGVATPTYLVFNDKSRQKLWLQHVLNSNEMSIAIAMTRGLDCIKNATKLFEGDLVPTLHFVVRELWNIKDTLGVLATDSDEHVSSFATELANLVETRFPNCGTMVSLYCVAHFLDPDYKGKITRCNFILIGVVTITIRKLHYSHNCIYELLIWGLLS